MLTIHINTDDKSRELANFLNKNVTHTLLATDKIYVGYYKPINSLFVGMNTANINPVTASLKYYNGSSFIETNAIDGTYGLTENGFIDWSRNIDDEVKATINSLELYWYELSVDVDTSEIIFSGMAQLFSDDIMLTEHEAQINSTKWYPSGRNDFLGYHQGARNEIIQRLRNEGKGIYNNCEFKDLTIYDILDYSQLSVASTYLALSKIFFNYSDTTDDKYYSKYTDYLAKFNAAFNLFFLSIDKNDDGKADASEQRGIQVKLMKRV